MNNTKNNQNANNVKKIPKYKTVFSLRIRNELKKRGIEPLVEVNNFNHPGYKCWKYAITDELNNAFADIMKGGQDYGK